MTHSTSEQQHKNLDTEVIRIEIEGHKYNVPMRYSYGQAIEKHGRWPTAKPERVKVGALTLSMLLPDLKPYFPEDDARWQAKGHGERIEVTITNSLGKPDWFELNRHRYFNGENQFSTRQTDANDLTLFAGNGYTSDIYFPVKAGIELILNCSKGSSSADYSPSCRVKTNYQLGIALNYYYSKNYLPDWQEIDSKLKKLFDEFEQDAQSALMNAEK